MRPIQGPSGFTLKDLLVVTAAIAVIVGISSVSIRKAHESARRNECGNNLKQLALALQTYHDTSNKFPFGTVVSPSLPPERRWSWYPKLWCYIFDGSMVTSTSVPWDAVPHRRPQVYHFSPTSSYDASDFPNIRCPEAKDLLIHGVFDTTSYVGVAGLGTDAPLLPRGHLRSGVFGYDRTTGLRSVTDGASSTILLIETGLDNGPWLAGGLPTVRGIDQNRLPYVGRDEQFFGLHRGGGNVLFVDGSMRFLSLDIEDRVLEQLSTIGANDGPIFFDE